MNVRKEIYEMLIEQLSKLYVTPEGGYGVAQTEDDAPEGWERAIKHIDLWNHNVEFIEQGRELGASGGVRRVPAHPVERHTVRGGVPCRADSTPPCGDGLAGKQFCR